MTTPPRTPEQLAQAIEDLIASYLDQGRQAALKALERSIPSGAGGRAKSSGATKARDELPAGGRRRPPAEIATVAERLYEVVRAQPGESMSRFAEQLGIQARDLHRPMLKLKSEGRVRSVGQRHLTRYFPAVGRRSRDS